MYKVFIKDLSDDSIIELPCNNFTIGDEINKGKDCNFTFNYKAIEEIASVYGSTPIFLFTSNQREIYIEKEVDGTSTAVYRGVVTDFALNKNDQGVATITLASCDYFWLLGKRYTDDLREFSSTDSGDIAWTIINDSQTSDNPYSDLGITRGAHPTTVDRDRTFRFDNVKDAIIKMSNAELYNGFDFEIDSSKVFNIYYPQKGTQRDEIILDGRVIKTWQFNKPLLSSLVNKVYVIGAGLNDDTLFVTRTSSTDYRSAFGTLEDVITAREIITEETLNDKGDKALIENQAPIITLYITHSDKDIDILDYNVGDSLKVKIDEIEVNAFYRVQKRSISVDANGQATIGVTLK